MTKTRCLDQGEDVLVAEAVLDAVEDIGVNAEEAIPGLVRAIHILAELTSDPELALDEAADLLSDGLQED